MSYSVDNTVEPVLKDQPSGKKNVVCQDRSLVTGSVDWNVGPSATNWWSVKTGGLSWQWSLKTGFTVCSPEVVNQQILGDALRNVWCKQHLQVLDIHNKAIPSNPGQSKPKLNRDAELGIPVVIPQLVSHNPHGSCGTNLCSYEGAKISLTKFETVLLFSVRVYPCVTKSFFTLTFFISKYGCRPGIMYKYYSTMHYGIS